MDAKGAPLFAIEENIIKAQNLPPLQEDERLNELILDNLKKHPDFVGFIDAETGESRTYGEMAEASVRCAIWLQKEGIGPGDIIALCTHNSVEAWVPYCATFFIGANLNPWIHFWTTDTAKYFANLTKPKVFFVNEDNAKMLSEILREENIESKIIVFGNVPGFESFDDIIKKQNADDVVNFQCHPVNPEDDAFIFFTSGSTGWPKGVQHSYRGFHYRLYRMSNIFEKSEHMVMMWHSSLCGIMANQWALWSILSVYRVIIVNDLTPESLCRNVEKFKVQFVFSMPPLLNELFNSYGMMKKFDLSSIKYFVVSGAKVRADVSSKINCLLKDAGADGEVLQGYGLTEGGGYIAFQKKGHNNHDSVGRVCFDVNLRIIDSDTEKILGPNQVGEVVVKMTHMMKFYFQNPEATGKMIDEEGWLHTGDLGYHDSAGNIYIVDRLKEMMKYRGYHIWPIEIERLLTKHPEVVDAAVVPVPHSVDGEHPMAFVVKTENAEVSQEELEKLISVLDDPKKLRGGIVFIGKLPRASTGKIDRMKLKEIAKTYHGF